MYTVYSTGTSDEPHDGGLGGAGGSGWSGFSNFMVSEALRVNTLFYMVCINTRTEPVTLVGHSLISKCTVS